MNVPDRKASLMGIGESRPRKEDAHFIQGKGRYVDDIKLPGMVHIDIVRSPLAHARIKKFTKKLHWLFLGYWQYSQPMILSL